MINDYDTVEAPTAEEMAIADEHFEIIALSTGKMSDNTPYWAYVAVDPSKYEAFATATPPFDLEDYGTILRAGEGNEPPEDVKSIMEIQMGVDHNINDQIIEMSERLDKEREIRTRYSIPSKKDIHE